MAKYTAAFGALVAAQGAVAVLGAAAAAVHTRVVPRSQHPPPDRCHPQGTIVYGNAYPPCLSQGEVEGKCAPPTQDAAGWEFQRECMCQGSFFEDAGGCIGCKQANGIQGYSESDHWRKVFDSIQAGFCKKATPTSNFGGYWHSALAAVGSPVPTLGDKREDCAKSSDLPIENYYKPTKAQGPGLVRPTVASVVAMASTAAASASEVELHAAATALYFKAAVTGVPNAPNSPKYPLNSTHSDPRTKPEVHYRMAALPCTAAYVDGGVRPACGAYQLMPNSSAMIGDKAKPDAVDFGACPCAAELLAAKNQSPVVGPVSPVSPIFSPEECTGPCHVPATGTKGDKKANPAKPKEECVTGAAGKNSNKPTSERLSSDKPSGGKMSEAIETPEEKPASGSAPAKGDKAPANGDETPEGTVVPGAKTSGSSPAKGDNGPAAESGKEGVPVAGTSGAKADKANPAAAGAAPQGTGAPVRPSGPVGPVPITAGAARAGVSAVALAVAVAVCAL